MKRSRSPDAYAYSSTSLLPKYSPSKTRRIDHQFWHTQKLEQCNVRRAKKIKQLERRVTELEDQVQALTNRLNFLENVAQDYENENAYFRRLYYEEM